MNGLLVRVGIDSTCGEWNAPVNGDGDFAYVPIPEGRECRRGLGRKFDSFISAASRFGSRVPLSYIGETAHVDPDFEYLTFGDQGQRGRSISKLGSGDILVFYAGLRSVLPNAALVYAIIGIFVLDEVVRARDVPRDRWHENAHTRRLDPGDDVIARAVPGKSGRIKRCLPIGSYRDRAYRVTPELLERWGGLSIRDGYIHRSVQLPRFLDAPRFYRWFLNQKPALLQENNPMP